MCQHCENFKPIFETISKFQTITRSNLTNLTILRTIIHGWDIDININYCPMCGRKLNKQPPAMAKENKDG